MRGHRLEYTRPWHDLGIVDGSGASGEVSCHVLLGAQFLLGARKRTFYVGSLRKHYVGHVNAHLGAPKNHLRAPKWRLHLKAT